VCSRTRNAAPGPFYVRRRPFQYALLRATALPTGTELALTYRLEDDSLYLLDRLDAGRDRFLRILRISRQGIGKELARVPYKGHFDRLFLTATQDGLLLLSASRSRGNGPTVFLLLEPAAAGLRLRGRHVEPGSLLRAPDALSPAAIAAAIERSNIRGVALLDIPRSEFHMMREGSGGNNDQLSSWIH